MRFLAEHGIRQCGIIAYGVHNIEGGTPNKMSFEMEG